jgi:hypothetical protein
MSSDEASPARFREVMGERSMGGFYERSDEEVLAGGW